MKVSSPPCDCIRRGELVAVWNETAKGWRSAVVLELSDYMVFAVGIHHVHYEVLRTPEFVRPVKLVWCQQCARKTIPVAAAEGEIRHG